MTSITWFGHAAFRIDCGDVSILVDPFFAPSSDFTWKDARRVDVVLVTHDHGDHVGDAVEICRHWGAKLGCVVGTAQALQEKGVPASHMLGGIEMGFNIGGTLNYKGVAITMVQAFHSSDSGVPVGYIIKAPGVPAIYHAGDTGIFASMSLFGSIYNVGVALLPIGGVFTMDGLQAAHACKLLGCSQVIPMHWGTFPILAQNTDEFRRHLREICPQCACVDAMPGKAWELE